MEQNFIKYSSCARIIYTKGDFMLTYNFDDKTYRRLPFKKDGVSSSVYESSDEYLKNLVH